MAGVDEVGRGCLAGPVVAAAVVLHPGTHIRGLRDSKLLTAQARGRLRAEIAAKALAWSVSAVDVADIDTLNIHRASLEAMRRAVGLLTPLPDCVIVDGFRIPGLLMAQRAIVGGDRQCAAIAAASIVAKEWRDEFMCRLHEEDPRYGFDRHKGYATADHLRAVTRFGYSAMHRRSFRPPSLFDTMDP